MQLVAFQSARCTKEKKEKEKEKKGKKNENENEMKKRREKILRILLLRFVKTQVKKFFLHTAWEKAVGNCDTSLSPFPSRCCYAVVTWVVGS